MFESMNDRNRQVWLKETLKHLPEGSSILDAGAGELRNKVLCKHLNYVSQDFCQYEGKEKEGLKGDGWDTGKIDIVCDITDIPRENESFDVVLCSEVLEHVPDPVKAVEELVRLLKPGGTLILTAPFSSNVHMAPYFYSTGFSRYWYEYHLSKEGLNIKQLVSNGDWHDLLEQELCRLGGLDRARSGKVWILGYLYAMFGRIYLNLCSKKVKSDDIACFGWHCEAVKKKRKCG